MSKKYIFKTKFVKTPEEYISAVRRGYCIIRYPQKIKKSLLKALDKVKEESLDLQCSYLQVITDNDVKKMKYVLDELQVLSEQGNMRAANCVGCVLYSEPRNLFNDNRIMFFLCKAANAGYAPAKYNLALFYDRPENEHYCDEGTAANLFLEAADMGLAPAQYTYAVRYAPDIETKKKYLYLAAKQKYEKAYAKLGDVVTDSNEQLRWYKKALKAGNQNVYTEIASVYAENKEDKKAIYYYTKGMRLGQEQCAKCLLLFYSYELSQKVIEEAEGLIYKYARQRRREARKNLKELSKPGVEFNKEMIDAIEDFDDDDEPFDSAFERALEIKRKRIEEREQEKDNKKQKVEILSKSFELMELVILDCYKENDEKGTFDNIAKHLEDVEKRVKTGIDRAVLESTKEKLDNLSYAEIAEIYDMLS